MSTGKKKQERSLPEKVDSAFEKGLRRGENEKGLSKPVIDLRKDDEKAAEKRGNHMGKDIASKKEKGKKGDAE